jgi:exodeoxyribonuclease VII large subunit
MNQPAYLTVKALTKYLKRKFDADPYLRNVMVKGEISNFKQHTSGHMYFTLKDDQARILAVMFSAMNRRLKFQPENGMQVLVKGEITVYEASGQYQIYVKEMQPDGIGELFLAFEQLKEKLEKEGLFRPEIKKKIPSFPAAVGVVTSPTGAAIRDIITTIKRRFPITKVYVYPALVQGENAASSVAKAIAEANRNEEIDVLIVGRGGGSIEELWAFNEEVVARAIHHSRIPVISAVGHETDFTIADFVADMRAPTPTGAAELAVPQIDDVLEKVLTKKMRLIRAVSEKVNRERKRYEALKDSYVLRNPASIYVQKMEKVDRLTEKLIREQRFQFHRLQDYYSYLSKQLFKHHPGKRIQLASENVEHQQLELHKQMVRYLNEHKKKLGNTLSVFSALNPMKIMERGYGVVFSEDQTVIKSTEQVDRGDNIQIRLSDGQLDCRVTEVRRDHNGN